MNNRNLYVCVIAILCVGILAWISALLIMPLVMSFTEGMNLSPFRMHRAILAPLIELANPFTLGFAFGFLGVPAFVITIPSFFLTGLTGYFLVRRLNIWFRSRSVILPQNISKFVSAAFYISVLSVVLSVFVTVLYPLLGESVRYTFALFGTGVSSLIMLPALWFLAPAFLYVEVMSVKHDGD